VLRHEAKFQGASRGGITSGKRFLPGDRRSHHALSDAQDRERSADAASRHHADGTLDGRARRRHGDHVSNAHAHLSNCPRIEVEVGLAQAYNGWLCDNILDKDPRLKSMLYLPFHDPDATYKIITSSPIARA